MNKINYMPIITLQRVLVDRLGTQHTHFTAFEAIENCEKKVVINTDGSRTTLYKDSIFMFAASISEEGLTNSHVLNTLIKIGGGIDSFLYSRFVLGDATSAYDQERFFGDINKDLEYLYGKDGMEGYYLNKTGCWCNTDENGNELVVNYIRVPATSTHASGYAHKHPERTNNYPVPSHLAVRQHITVKPSAPKMSVNDWLNTPMEELLSDDEKALAMQRGIEKDAKLRRKGLLFRNRLERLNEDKARFALWKVQQAQKAADEEIYGTQLELI